MKKFDIYVNYGVLTHEGSIDDKPLTEYETRTIIEK